MAEQIQNPKLDFKPHALERREGFKIQYLALALLLLVYIIVAVAHAALAPLTTGPDELAHYEYVRFITDHNRLPLNAAEREQASYKSDQPPLYHLLTAFPAAWADASGPSLLKRVSDHPRRQLIERTRHAWGLYNTENEQWPYQGEVLRWQIGRWAAIFFGAATVVVTFFIARGLFDKLPGSLFRSWSGKSTQVDAKSEKSDQATGRQRSNLNLYQAIALGAAAIVAFIPRYVLTGSMLNYETTLAFCSALFLWILIKMAEANSQPTASASGEIKYAVLLGLSAGLAITAKLSALIFPLEVLLAYWLIARHYGWGWKIWLRQVSITAAATLVAVGWWFGFVIYQFNTVTRDGWWTGILQPLVAADASDATTNRLLNLLTFGDKGFVGAIDNLDSGPPWEWVSIFFRTFWVVGIEEQQPLGLFGLAVALGLCLLAAYGLIVGWRQTNRQLWQNATGTKKRIDSPLRFADHESQTARLMLSLLLLHVSMAFILPLIRYAVTFSLADTAQGRHILFQTAPAIAILLVWGVSISNEQLAMNNYRFGRVVPIIPGLLLLVWTGVQLWTMTWAYNPPLPVATAQLAALPMTHVINKPLNEFVTLLGYDSRLDQQSQLLQVDLLWQARAVSPVDYLTELRLVDSMGGLQAEWLGYSAGGRYPTRAWDAGDSVRDTVWLPTGGLDPGQYSLELKLLPNTVTTQDNSSPAESFSLGSVTLPDATSPVFSKSLPFIGDAQAAGYSLWQDGQAVRQPRLFRYRETILVSLSPLRSEQKRIVELVGVGSAAGYSFSPIRHSDTSALFIVGPAWPGGDYQLQVVIAGTGQQGQQAESEPLVRVVDRWERDFNEPVLQHRVEANFANQVRLLGYELVNNRASPGGGVPVTLYWQGLDWLGDDYTMFTKLLAADQTVHGGRDRLPRESYRTLYWAPQEIVSDSFGVPINEDAPEGVYYLNLGLYKEVDGQAVSLPLMNGDQLLDDTSLNIGPIKIGAAPARFLVETVDPQVAVNHPFGANADLTLLGYDLTDETDQPIQNLKPKIQNLKLTLYWRSERILPTDYTTFVHLRNAVGEVVAQKDQPPLQGAYPTSLWDPGEIIADELIVPLPDKLPLGEYQIVIGMYDFQTGHRLMVSESDANEVVLAAF